MKILFESRAIEDAVASRTGVVNDELVLCSRRLSSGGLGLLRRQKAGNPV